MMPQRLGVRHAERVELERQPLQPREQLRADDARRVRSQMFSSWPESALVAGVKIGSGSRSDSRRPAGSAMPQTSPVAL